MAVMAELMATTQDISDLCDSVIRPREDAVEMDGPIELDDMEKLAIAQAFMNRVGDMVSTKDPDNLRGLVNGRMVELYDETGAKSFDVKLRGEKVGTYSLTVSKPTKSKTVPTFEVGDKGVLKGWKDFQAAALDYADSHPGVIAEWHFGNTGELPDGCEMVDVVYPGDPGGQVTRSTLRIDSDAVAEVIGAELGAAARLMLEGGADD